MFFDLPVSSHCPLRDTSCHILTQFGMVSACVSSSVHVGVCLCDSWWCRTDTYPRVGLSVAGNLCFVRGERLEGRSWLGEGLLYW